MKKWIVLFVLILAPMLIIAQDPEIPADIADLLANLQTFLGTLAGMAGTTIFLAGFIIRLSKAEQRWVKLLVGFVTAIILAVLTNLLNFGLFAESTWLQTLLYGAGLGFVAGSLVDIPTMKVLLDLILSLIKLKKPA